MIDFHKIVESELKKERRKPGRLYVSDIGNCLRKTFYAFTCPREQSPELFGRFFVGDLIHQKITEFLSERYPTKSERDVVIYIPGVGRIFGRYDNLVEVGDEKILIEKKSTSRIDLIEEPSRHDLFQIQVYLGALGIGKGILVYFEKNTFKVKQFEIEFSPEIFEEALNRAKTIFKCVEERRLPEKEEGWECRYCPYKDKCERDEL